MKAMLLAAGRGERMRPLTDHTAKPLIEVNNKALIEYHLEKLKAAGIQEVVINTCWHADKIVEKIADGKQFGLRVHYSHEQQALETAGGIANASHLLGPEPFLLISADIWSDIEFTGMTKPPDKKAHLVLVDNPLHNPDGDFCLENGLVSKRINSGFTYSGIGIFDPAIFADLPTKRFALREVLNKAIDRQQISGEKLQGTWFDIGTPERLASLKEYLKSA